MADTLLARMHCLANNLSAGQGNCLALYCKNPATTINIVATRKTLFLYFEIQTISGKTATNELKAAPAPIATKKAGSAQHTMVPVLVKRDKKAIFLLEFSPFNSSFLFILSTDCSH